ncbi:MAG: hypothetical protein KDA85_10585 [Planctomycetaceae bacterium]|nr:hypothetical protein [Planctomycetaceae bacterium]
MRIPKYWGEARVQSDLTGRQITVRRYGWSDVSVEEAQQHARERAAGVLREIEAGQDLPRRERKVPYNGSDGVPIREEILANTPEYVVTRNSYGARCLNTADVFFADLDFPAAVIGCRSVLFSFLIAAAACVWFGVTTGKVVLPLLLCIGLTVVVLLLLERLLRLVVQMRGGFEQISSRLIDRFLERNPDWHLRIYRSPNGFRVMALHQTFSAQSREVHEAFGILDVDPTYRLMCRKQDCFRARLSGKPWRMGLMDHMKPRPGVWPVDPSRMEERAAWVNRYETLASTFAACRFVAAKGAIHKTHPVAEIVCRVHDEFTGALTNRPLA